MNDTIIESDESVKHEVPISRQKAKGTLSIENRHIPNFFSQLNMVVNQSPDHKDKQYQAEVNALLDELDSFFNYQGEKKLNNNSKMFFLHQRALKIREAASKGSRDSVDGCSE